MNKRRVKRRSSTTRTEYSPVPVQTSESKLQAFSRRHALSILLIVIAIVGFFNAFRFGAASLDYYTVKNLLDEWRVAGAVDSKESYLNAKKAITTARSLHQTNPLYVDLSGQITEWGVVSGFSSSEYLNIAKSDYLQATKMRPLWPVSWANLAMLKWRMQEFDEEMLTYLTKADTLGKQSVEVHLLFSRLGISLYKANHPFYTQFKETIHTRIKLGLRSAAVREQVIAFIDDSDAQEDVCRWLKLSAPVTLRQQLAC